MSMSAISGHNTANNIPKAFRRHKGQSSRDPEWDLSKEISSPENMKEARPAKRVWWTDRKRPFRTCVVHVLKL